MVAIRPPTMPSDGGGPSGEWAITVAQPPPPVAAGEAVMTATLTPPVIEMQEEPVARRRMIVRGGARLVGEITTNGAKNAATKMMASALLTREPVVLENVPSIQAVRTQASLLRSVGAIVEFDERSHRMTIVAEHITNERLPADLSAKERSSFLLVGPMLARHCLVEAPMPGGCQIGERPVDVQLHGFELMGAEIVQEDGAYLFQTIGLRGARIYLDYPSHTGTENLMMAACLANGTTVIMNAACEPEVVGLAEHLTRMGALIRGAGTPKIEIVGVPQLRGARTWVMPDRIEAGSFAIAAAATSGDLVIRRVVPEHLESLTYKLNEAGADVFLRDDALLVRSSRPLRAVEVQALQYPVAFVIAGLMAEGATTIRDFYHAERGYEDLSSRLRSLGADLSPVDG